jgi:hypothetical protein
MGWNDRLPDDPNIPYESAQDRDDYDAWSEYVESCRIEAEAAAGGLTSQTVDPAAPPDKKINFCVSKMSTRDRYKLILDRIEKLIAETKPKN